MVGFNLNRRPSWLSKAGVSSHGHCADAFFSIRLIGSTYLGVPK